MTSGVPARQPADDARCHQEVDGGPCPRPGRPRRTGPPTDPFAPAPMTLDNYCGACWRAYKAGNAGE